MLIFYVITLKADLMYVKLIWFLYYHIIFKTKSPLVSINYNKHVAHKREDDPLSALHEHYFRWTLLHVNVGSETNKQTMELK